MLIVLHVFAVMVCAGIVFAGGVLILAQFGAWRVDAAVARALADDRLRVEQAYEAGGWDRPVTDTPDL